MRTVWIDPADVTGGDFVPGRLVQAARPLADWCLRADDGSEPIPAGTALEIIEDRPWGKAMAQELPALHAVETGAPDEGAAIMAAMVELQAVGLWEFEPAGARG